jgi:hypothetical protein
MAVSGAKRSFGTTEAHKHKRWLLTVGLNIRMANTLEIPSVLNRYGGMLLLEKRLFCYTRQMAGDYGDICTGSGFPTLKNTPRPNLQRQHGASRPVAPFIAS